MTLPSSSIPYSAVSEESRSSDHLHLVHSGTISPPNTFYVRRGKRTFDLVAGTLLLVMLAIPMLIMALTIRCTSHGRALFVQERVGRHMSTFRCLKFRTMVKDAENILLENPQLQDAMAVSWKIHDDPRVTSMGRVLRKTSMDELPQLINVIKGEMSLVGPRPYMPSELKDSFGEHAVGITSVRPGMTGLWQVSGRSHLAPHDRIDLDEKYIATTNFQTDLVLLLRTVRVVFSRNGAY